MNIYQNKQTRNLIDHSYRKKGIKDNFGSFRLTKLDRSKKMVSKHKNNKRLCTKQRSKSAYILTHFLASIGVRYCSGRAH